MNLIDKRIFIRKNINSIKDIVKKIIAITGYSLHIKILKIDRSEILKYKIGQYIFSYPANHQLINIITNCPDYSQNISRISKLVKSKYPDLHIIDVGANIGDTVIFIRNAVNCPILAIEGDSEFYNFLKTNTQLINDISISKIFLDEIDHKEYVIINKSNGSLNLISGADDEITEFVKLDTLLKKYPIFKNSKILKVDTDGYDIKVLKGSYDLITTAKPIIFFEYYTNLYPSPNTLIDYIKFLEKIDYYKIVIYDNYGRFLMKININDDSVINYLTLYIKNNTAIFYYDFCVFHKEDDDLCSQLCEVETIVN